VQNRSHTSTPATLELICPDATSTAALGAQLGQILRGGDCVALCGGLGAGKTTLVQGMVAGLGSRDRVTSPTFTLVNEYTSPDKPGLTIFHADLYRLAEIGGAERTGAGVDPHAVALQAATLGLDDVIGMPDALVIVEWADLAPALLPPDCLHVTLSATEEGGRCIHLEAPATARRAQAVLAELERMQRATSPDKPTSQG